MVDLMSRAAAAEGDERTPAPAWLAGLVAGAAMAFAGVVAAMGLAVTAWLGGDGGTIGGALRIGADAWLLGHGSRLRLAEGTIGIVPLAIPAVAGWQAYRSGRWAAGVAELPRPLDAVTVAATFACAYGAVVLVVGLLASDAAAEPSLIRPLLVSAVVTFATCVLGALRAGGLDEALVEWAPEELRACATGAAVGAGALLAAAFAAIVVSMIVHVGELRELLSVLDPGPVGGVVLLVACLLVLPNAVLYAVAVLLGPGVAIGTGTSVTLSEVTVGPLPTVPWFAAVPSSGGQPAALSALAAVPLMCGVVAGAYAVRCHPVFGHDRAALRGGLAGVAAGLVIAALVAVSGGAIGPGRMADVGPDVLACLAVAPAALGAGGLIGGIAARVLSGRRGP